MDIEPTRFFRLAPGRIACDAEGLRIGDLPLLARDPRDGWTMRPAQELNPALASVYGFPVDVASKRGGLSAVARALNEGDLARAQVTALFLHLPDPPDSGRPIEKLRLASELASCGLLKADPDWDAKHPRTGTAPNSGWFATTAGAVGSLMTRDLSPAALHALETLATRIKVATIVFDTLFVPSANAVVEQGAVPGRSDMSYTWAHDQRQIFFHVLIDGQWRTLVQGERGADNLVRDAEGNVVGRIVGGPRGETLVADLGALDRAARALGGAKTSASDASGEDQPKLCPEPTREPMTTYSMNSIKYQEYVSGMAYGLAVVVGGVRFDGCDEATGWLKDAKANIDFLFDANGNLMWFVDPDKFEKQLDDQQDAAVDSGRLVTWHMQTQKGYLGISNMLASGFWPNIRAVYDPHTTGYER